MPKTYNGILRGQHGKSLCCPAFSLSFNGLLVLVLFQSPDKVPNDLDFLSAVADGLVGRVDDYLLHKLIDDGRRQFRVPTYLRITAAKLLKSALSCS